MDDLATRCRTVATRLSKPHSEHIKDAAFDHLHEAAARIEALTEDRFQALVAAYRRGAEWWAEYGGSHPDFLGKAACDYADARAAIAQPSRED